MGRFVDKSNPPDYRVLSYGGGVQSTALLYMNVMGLIDPPADFAVFADTQWEPSGVYDTLRKAQHFCEEHDFPLYTTTRGSLREKELEDDKYIWLPLYTKDKDGKKGQLRRVCTNKFKIEPLSKKIRRVMGYKGQTHTKHLVEIWLGLTTDEVWRVKNDSRISWQIFAHPLLDLDMSRDDCKQWLLDNGFDVPVKSSCIGCPYRTNPYWRELKTRNDAEWRDLVEFDEAIRHKAPYRPNDWDNRELYVHRNVIPMTDVDLDVSLVEMESEECSGYCFL